MPIDKTHKRTADECVIDEAWNAMGADTRAVIHERLGDDATLADAVRMLVQGTGGLRSPHFVRARDEPHPLGLVEEPTLDDIRLACFAQAWALRDACSVLERDVAETFLRARHGGAVDAMALARGVLVLLPVEESLHVVRAPLAEVVRHLEAAIAHESAAQVAPEDRRETQRKFATSEVRLAKRCAHDALALMATLWQAILPQDD